MINNIINRGNSVLYFIMLFISSCAKPDIVSINHEMSLFAFIISDNNLDDHTDYIENDLVNGLKGCPTGTELFLYIDRQKDAPSLKHLFLLESGKVGINIITQYNEQCSTSPTVFRDVLNTMIDKSSGNQYGLIYWSHGNGWLPGLRPDNGLRYPTRALGSDGIYSMDIEDMSNVLLENKTPLFIVLDACFMGAVEVAYTLRNSTYYLIASPAETLGLCFPYHLMIPELIKGSQESLSHSLDKYLDYCYSDYYNDGTISGMASLIDCTQMESLASAFRNIMINHKYGITKDSIQSFDCTYPHIYYDLGDFAHNIATDSLALSLFDHQMCKTVVHKVTTPSVFTQTGGRDSMLTIKNCSGLSTYIFGTTPIYDNAYKQTEWYVNCYGKK